MNSALHCVLSEQKNTFYAICEVRYGPLNTPGVCLRLIIGNMANFVPKWLDFSFHVMKKS
jgi:hypothetical protein